MGYLYISDVPEKLKTGFKAYAAMKNTSMRELVLNFMTLLTYGKKDKRKKKR